MRIRGGSHAQERQYPLAATFDQSNKSRKLDDPIKDGVFAQAVPLGRARRLVTVAVPVENSNVTALAVTRCLRAMASHLTRMAGQKGASVFLEAKVTEVVFD